MIISLGASGDATIKTKNDTVTVGNGVKIGTYQISSGGEYDVAGIQCDVSYLDQAMAYFMRIEDLNVTFLTDTDASVTKSDDASKTDILIADVRSDTKAEDLKPIIKALEPAYLVLIGSGAGSLKGSLDLPPVEGSQLKVTRSSLPLEGTHVLA